MSVSTGAAHTGGAEHPLRGRVAIPIAEHVEPVGPPLAQVPVLDARGHQTQGTDLPRGDDFAHALVGGHEAADVGPDNFDSGLLRHSNDGCEVRRRRQERLFAENPLHASPCAVLDHPAVEAHIRADRDDVRLLALEHLAVVGVAGERPELRFKSGEVFRVDIRRAGKRGARALPVGLRVGVADLVAATLDGSGTRSADANDC